MTSARTRAWLVTGATSGIGRALALRLGPAGARVAAVGRDTAALAQLEEACGAVPIAADLAEASEVERTAAEALAALGAVDVLVNNAGIGSSGPFEELEPSRAERLLHVNLLAPALLTRALLPGMLERRSGHVVNVASVVGHTGRGGEALYAASKAGLALLTESLLEEYRGRGVGFTLVSPGVVATPFFERRGRPYERPWPRPIPPERVAAAIVAGVERRRERLFVPGWMALPARLNGAAPGLFRALAARLD